MHTAGPTTILDSTDIDSLGHILVLCLYIRRPTWAIDRAAHIISVYRRRLMNTGWTNNLSLDSPSVATPLFRRAVSLVLGSDVVHRMD